MSEVRWPVSIKGVVLAADSVLLLENERDEWEPPGGRLETGETPEECVIREIREETGLTVEVEQILDPWVYPILPDHCVLIVPYGCRPLIEIPVLTVSDEHRRGAFIAIEECAGLSMPSGYLAAISGWAEVRGTSGRPGG